MSDKNIKEALADVSAYMGNKIARRQNIFRYSEMPQATKDNFGKIVQYIGDTSRYYIRGYFYGCAYVDDEYMWLRRDVQPNGGGSIVSIPQVSVGSYEYNGEEQGPSVLGIDPWMCTITDERNTDAGEYNLTFSLKNKTDNRWADGSKTDKVYSYSIAKISQTISVPSTTVTLDADNPSIVIPVSGVKGTLSATSSDNSIVSTSVNNNNVTIAGLKNGNATVTVVCPEGTNYSASNTIMISVSADVLKVGSFAELTDSQLVALVAAADAGEVDLYNDAGWRVGDERDVILPAITGLAKPDGYSAESYPSRQVTLVLMHKGGYQLTTPTSSGRTTCSFVVGLKYPLGYVAGATTYSDNYLGAMNITSKIPYSYKNSDRRAWLNSTLYNAFPESIRPIFKQAKIITAVSYNSGNTEATDDYMFLPAEKEYLGSQSYCTSAEASALPAWTYFSDTSNRWREVSGRNLWLRSPVKSADLCSGTYRGSTDYFTATSPYLGIRPCACI